MEKKINFELYLRILVAFFISFLIFYIIVGYPISNFFLYYLVFFIPTFIISAIIVLLSINLLSKSKFNRLIRKRNINVLSVIIVIVCIVLALLVNIFISSQYLPPTELIGTWGLNEGQEPMVAGANKNLSIEINTLEINYDPTYGWNRISFCNNICLDFMFHYDKSSKEITIYDIGPDDWELILKLNIHNIENASMITTYYISDTGFPWFNVTLIDGLTWTKISSY